MKKVAAADVAQIIRAGGDFKRDIADKPRFSPGDRIVVKNLNPIGHTRLPRYVRGRIGTVQSWRGAYVFPDTTAHDRGEKPQHVYCVKFESADLWGPGVGGHDVVYLDLWDDYIAGLAGAGPYG